MSHEDRDRPRVPNITSADVAHADRMLSAVWCRGAADILFDIEAAHSPGYFGSAGLGLVAAQLLDHAHCIEFHTAARPVVQTRGEGGRP